MSGSVERVKAGGGDSGKHPISGAYLYGKLAKPFDSPVVELSCNDEGILADILQGKILYIWLVQSISVSVKSVFVHLVVLIAVKEGI